MEETEKLKEQIREWYNCWFRLRGIYQLWAEKRGLTYNELFVLYEINKHETGCAQREICDYLMLSKQTVSAILKKLEKDGHITRETKTADKRNNLVLFTAKGVAYAKPMLEELFKLETEAYGHMEQHDMDQIIAGSAELAGALEESFRIKERL